MRKIINEFDYVDETSIGVTANECMEVKKRANYGSPKIMKIIGALFGVAMILSLFGNPVYIFTNLLSISSILFNSYNLRKTSEDTLRLLCNRMAWMAGGCRGEQNKYFADVDVDIVPKNMQIGFDLDAVNLVPIFKEGKYVIIKSFDYPCFIRVFENDGIEEAYAMEAVDEDITLLEEELPEYKEYIDVLKLQKKLPKSVL